MICAFPLKLLRLSVWEPGLAIYTAPIFQVIQAPETIFTLSNFKTKQNTFTVWSIFPDEEKELSLKVNLNHFISEFCIHPSLH